MMISGIPSHKKRAKPNHPDLINLVFSWSLEDICSESLHKSQLERIPQSFQSVQHYLGSFVSPLLEEIRAELSSSMEAISNAPFAKVLKYKPYETRTYDVTVDYWRNISSHQSKVPYGALPGDIFVFTEAKPETIDDLKRSGRTLTLGCVRKRTGDDDIAATHFKVEVPNDSRAKDGMHKFSYVVFLINITTSKRIWSALHMLTNQEVMEKLLYTNTTVDETCNLCSEERNQIWEDKLCLSSKLNESQYKAVVSSICKIQCNHRSFVELIWGPPGTGKTRTLGMLLWALLGLKCRTLTCAPTNIAITEVASRVVEVVRKSFDTGARKDALFCSLGDILLCGNKARLKVSSDVQDVYLDYRVENLAECFGSPITGWKYCFTSMIEFLEGCVSKYQNFCDNQFSSEKCSNGSDDRKVEQKSFLQFVRDRFRHAALALRRCVSTICTHVPISCIKEHNFQRMVSLIALLDSFETLLNRDDKVFEELNEVFSKPELVDASQSDRDKFTVPFMRSECLCALKTLQCSLDELDFPTGTNKDSVEEFCFQNASLILCTSSSSHKLHSVSMEPLRLLVIDEAAQMKECESIIPLQLPGIRHVILIGDECQLPAMVRSKVSEEAGFGRSLFERLTLMGHSKHLLNIQYRMHPSICSFPNSKFYQSQIMDAPNVKSCRKCYLPGPMFGHFSFINISCGKEVRDAQGSWMNMVEVAVVLKILQLLHKACKASKQKVSVGVVTPYSAQIAELNQKIGKKYENHDSFTVKVKTIDGFQGGEEDVIIISTVRCDRSIEFISSPQRTNVALTRARHCLWILGNERALSRSKSVWEELICDAKARECYFSADENKDIKKVVLEVMKELDQLDDLLNGDSMLFKNKKWKVLFSDNFRKSFAKLKSLEMKKLVLHYLSKLSTGWRPKWNHADINCESSSQILKKFYIMGHYIVCSNDIDMVKESWCQILKVWDVLPLEEIPKLDRRLDGVFRMYTDDYLNRCKVKYIEGVFEVPMTWDSSSDTVKYKISHDTEAGNTSNVIASEESYIENTKVGDSFSLMKFYSLSSGMVSHMLSGYDGKEMGLPFELTSQQKEIILFNRSTFILGRSGTGKTSVLTTKLIQNEQLYYIASEGFHGTKSDLSTDVSGRSGVSESDRETKGAVLHQIFVTVSPKLCYAVKQDVSQLKSFICQGKSSAESSSIRVDDIDDTTQFTNIPDSFVDLPPELYPLVITFHKFLMMLNGTVGTSYFERFPEVRKLCHGKTGNSRSVALETFIRTKEVNYDKFVWSYWPHFNTYLTKKLDPSTVFTEIMSIIKGGLQAGKAHDGKLSRQDYVLLSEGRGSLIGEQTREIVYDIFLEYEKKKVVSGEFDLADLVVDLHCRLRNERYEGHSMDFVYIDEVQDLSMSQIALFKYICRNVDDGFVFSGDTAQTIARGIDFRFEDIRCLFYEEFVMGLKSDEIQVRKEKGHISDIFNLSQNFRTHAGVLKLAQSVIDLVYHFFPCSIDFLRPETSFVNGDAPILLESKNNETAIMTIFGNTANKVVGFGAEQVILVRDDCARKEIFNYVGTHALVLTVMECKGLEFQDVLLYNFFSSSPLRNQWRIIYGYMKEQNLLDSTSHTSFPSFNLEKHSVLCSELKQLYVAITRTRQRLWICENVEEFSEPMFDYWKKLRIVEEKLLDDSLAREMQIESSQEEWKSRGIKFFHEHNFKNAITCFERAGDTHWERYTKASQLRVAADQMRGRNTEMSDNNLRQAADIYESIGKHELAAQCFFELNEYERAGEIYLEKCGESKLESAGECFSLARCYNIAAEVYARANLHLKCLSACSDGKLFDKGLKYIESWKQDAATSAVKELGTNGQEFLQGAALHYYKLQDVKSMLRFVRSFQSMESIRIFLEKESLLDELLTLEVEMGNFLEAADIAKRKRDSLLEVDLVEKAELFREASMLILWYVFRDSLHTKGKEIQPLMQSIEKDKLLTRAKSIAKNHSDQFHEFVCMEADILSRGKANNGELLEMGLQFIQHWKLNAPEDVGRVKRRYEMKIIEQNMLERCARHYHDQKDYHSMMKYVEAFHSIESIRDFLRSLNCLNALLLLEERRGNFVEAANIAEQKGELLRKANLLEKAGQYDEASNIILWFVFARSLWVSQSKGWPLKQFGKKEELLTKAKSYARNHSDLFYEFVSVEVNILSNKEISLSELSEYWLSSHGHESLRVEILLVRKILDAHLNSDTSKYEWSNEMVTHMRKHSEDMISQNRISAETLVAFWNVWKQMIVILIDHYLQRIGQEEVSEYSNYEEFCLNYMGVRKHNCNQGTIYLLLEPHANWIREIDDRALQRNGNMAHIGARQFVFAALRYWSSEIFSVGVKVLETLKAIHENTVKNFFFEFHQSVLVCIFEVAKFLKEYKFHHCENNKAFVQDYLTPFIQSFIGHVFPHDWRKSFTENSVVLRGTNLSMNLINEAILANISSNGELATHGQMGRVVMMILGSGRLNKELYGQVRSCFCKSSQWMTFIEQLIENIVSDVALIEVSLVHKFHKALEDTYFANWRSEKDYISPTCFFYLLERLLFMVSYFRGCYIFTSKASLNEWLKNPNGSLVNDIKSSSLDLGEDIHNFIANLVQEMLLSKSATMEWIMSTENIYYYPFYVLRLIVLLCLVCVNFGKHFDKLFDLLDRSDISSQLPRAFCDAIRRRECYFVDAVADALKKIGNPLVVVGVGDNFSIFPCSDAVFVNLKVNKCREDILRELFSDEQKTMVGEKDFIYPFSNGNYGLFWEMFDASNSENERNRNVMSLVSAAPKIKVEVEKNFQLLSAAVDFFRHNINEDGQNLCAEANTMLDELRHLSFALDRSKQEIEDDISTIIELVTRLQLRGPRLDYFLSRCKMIGNKGIKAGKIK
ncbi:unnamed protein product [Camellia sinensis]